MNLFQDLKYALRSLRLSPGFSASVVLMLALGIGANTAIFSVVQGVLLRALPYADPENVVMLWEDGTSLGGTNRNPVASGNFFDWREANSAFTDLAALFNASLRLTAIDEPIVPLTQMVTTNHFDLLGVKPLLGRAFLPEEGRRGYDRVVVLSYGLWQRVLGGDSSVIGKPLELDGESYTVLGVLPPTYWSVHQFTVQPDLFIPLVLDGEENDRKNRKLVVYGRLRSGLGLTEAQSAMSALARRLAEEHPDTNRGWDIRVVPIREVAIGRVRTTLFILMGAVGFVLLIACANVANVSLSRATERVREVAVRRALGASGWELSRQLLSESLVLALLGGAVGCLIAVAALQPLLRMVPAIAGVPFLDKVALDERVLLFNLGLSVLTGFLFGLAPLRQASRLNIDAALKQRGDRRATTRGTRRFGNLLVIVEVTLAMVLMTGAALMIQSFRYRRAFEPGFDVERLLTVRNSLRGDRFAEPDRRIAHFRELASRLAALPGVESVSAVSFPPPTLAFQGLSFRITGEPFEPGHEPTANASVVLPGYFRTLGIPVLSGRALGEEDREDAAGAVVINEALARRYFGEQDPVGRTLVISSAVLPEVAALKTERQIVGVVGNVRTAGERPEPLPQLYVPHTQAPVPIMSFLLRAKDDPAALARPAERVAWGMGGDINVYGTESLAKRVADSEWTSQVTSLLLGLFAFLALALGAAGIYSLISYNVSRRRSEMGLRMALGAERRGLLYLVLKEGLALTSVGILVGAVASWLLTRFIAGLLFGVGPSDPGTFAGTVLVLLAVAAAASLVPAYRASRIDPIATLRAE